MAAYDWRFGPFLPRQIALNAQHKTRAYSVDDAAPARLRFHDSNRDYRNENNCEQLQFLRFTPADGSESGRRAIEWKERGDKCGPDRAVITSRHSDAARPDESWAYIPVLRKWRQLVLEGGYPNQSCSYSCTQIFFEYLPPKTEVYAITLIGSGRSSPVSSRIEISRDNRMRSCRGLLKSIARCAARTGLKSPRACAHLRESCPRESLSTRKPFFT